MAMSRLWEALGVKPSAVLGHSSGEYAALHASGTMSASDVLYLVGTQATLLTQKFSKGTHVMLSVRESIPVLRARFGSNLPEIACINTPNDTVLSGPAETVAPLIEALTASRVKYTLLNVPYAFHSAQIEPILSDFATKSRGVTFRDPSIAYISPYLGDVISDVSAFRSDYLSQACRGTVDFVGAVEAATKSNIIDSSTIWIEIGPHPVCSAMLKSILSLDTSALPTTSTRREPWSVLTSTLATLYETGIDINWSAYHFDFKAFAKVLEPPSYAWDAKNHWIQYKNNFCLTKGDAPVQQLQPSVLQSAFHTTASAQRVVREADGFIEVESDLAAPKLSGVVQGHKVNDTMLCPSVS